MDKQATAADLLAQIDEAQYGVLEHARTQALSLVARVYAKASQQGERLRIPTCPFSEPGWRQFEIKLCHAPGVVGDDFTTARFRYDKDFGRTRRCRLSSVMSKPCRLLG